MDNILNPVNHTRETLNDLLQGKANVFPTHLHASYPQIVEKICALWKNPVNAHAYFNDLLITQRENRSGFSPEIHHEIFALSNYYSSIYPQINKQDDFWSGLDN